MEKHYLDARKAGPELRNSFCFSYSQFVIQLTNCTGRGRAYLNIVSSFTPFSELAEVPVFSKPGFEKTMVGHEGCSPSTKKCLRSSTPSRRPDILSRHSDIQGLGTWYLDQVPGPTYPNKTSDVENTEH